MMNTERFLPLQEPTLYILLSLSRRENQGYAILTNVSELSGERVKLSKDTLYGVLYRLLDQGLIERIESKDRARGKKSYRLTRSGMELIDAEVGRMKRLLLVVNAMINASGGQQA
jgi:DNA-binding PadR family transcriptional regulator